MEQEKIVKLIMQETDDELLKEIYINGTELEKYIALTKIRDFDYLNILLYDNYRNCFNSSVIIMFIFLKTLNENFDPSRYKSIFENDVLMQQLDTEFHIYDNITSLDSDTNKELIAELLYNYFFVGPTKEWYSEYEYNKSLFREVKTAIVSNNETCAVKLIFHKNEYDVIKYLPKETFHKILNKSVLEMINEEERLPFGEYYDIWTLIPGICDSLFDDFCNKFMNDEEITEEMYTKILVNLMYSERMRQIVDYSIEKISDEEYLNNLRKHSINWYVKLLAGAKIRNI